MSTRQVSDERDVDATGKSQTIHMTVIPKSCEGCRKLATCETLKSMNMCKTGKKT